MTLICDLLPARLRLLLLLTLCVPCLVAQEPAPAPAPAAADADAGNPFVWKERGDTAYAGGDFAAAAQMYRRYFELAYHQDILIDALPPLMRSLIYSDQAAAAATVLEKVPERVRAMVPANAPAAQKQLSAENAPVFRYWQGRVAFLQGNHEVALRHFLAATEAPASAELQSLANYGAAETYAALEQWPAAEARFLRLVDEHLTREQQQEALVGLLRALVMQEKYEAADALARDEWENARGVFRTRVGMLYIASLLARDYVDQAYAIYKDAFVRAVDYLNVPSHFAIIRSLGRALIDEEKHDEAILVFERMLPLVDQEAQRKLLMLDLADAQSGAGQHGSAITQIQKFIQLYPRDERILQLRFRTAQLNEQLEKFDQAIAWYEQVFNDEQAPAELRSRAAQRIAWISREELQNYARAIHFFEAAAQVEVPDEVKASSLYHAAETRALIEDYDRAASQYGRIADTYPEAEVARQARFNQGLAYYSSRQFALADDAFGKFIKAWPEDDKIAEAMLKQGLAQHQADLNDSARQTLEAYARKYPQAAEAPYALLRASEAAAANSLPAEAIRLLTHIINEYPHSEHYPFALYKRAYQNLTQGRYDPAIADSLTFLEKYGQSMPELAPDVLLWLGDHFATINEYQDAERYFKTVVQDYPESSDAPVALYEAAKNAFRVRNYERAVADVDALLENYPEAPSRIRAQALFLRADIATLSGNYETAAELLNEAVTLVPGTRLYYAALGRLGESHYNLGNAAETSEDAQPHYRRALEYFAKIIDELENAGIAGRDSLVEKARYRKGRVHELLGEIKEARAEYNYIFWSYKSEEIQGNVIFDWYYFARAGFDLARLYIDEADYRPAITIYSRLGTARIPIANDAKARARELQRLSQSLAD